MISEKIYTIKQFSAAFPHHSENSLRWLIARSDQNGFESVIRRIGKRVYLVESEYFKWLNRQNGRAAND